MNILIGYDGSKMAKAAIEFVKLHAKALNAKVYIATSFNQSQEVNLEDMSKMEEAGKNWMTLIHNSKLQELLVERGFW